MKRRIVHLLILLLWGLFWLPLPGEAAGGEPETGGISILKTDPLGNPLAGATFRILREAAPEELQDSGVEKLLIKVGGESLTVVPVRFWDSLTLRGGKTDQVTTDEMGQAAMYALPYGTYYLQEVRAPEGYKRMTDPVRVRVNRYSHLTAADNVRDDEGKLLDNTIHIINIRYTVPETGGPDPLILTAGFWGVVFSAAALLLLNRLRRR